MSSLIYNFPLFSTFSYFLVYIKIYSKFTKISLKAVPDIYFS